MRSSDDPRWRIYLGEPRRRILDNRLELHLAVMDEPFNLLPALRLVDDSPASADMVDWINPVGVYLGIDEESRN
ncbi:hypothetical protein OIDMADRAFT_20684 [Oidiodendron maius Zn]|uniref:Uncharacterized protein n=1 Tax=Oidiodendron maius (strain Zn) TaxID=913774 RepID=A0A0C3CDA2_OIDMZ|nr:hypothetical protein OIDMADRAFT_20684 [Oidiodendron maius Zn]